MAEAVLLHGAAMCKRAVALAKSPEIALVSVDVTTAVVTWRCYYSVVVAVVTWRCYYSVVVAMTCVSKKGQ